MTTTVLTPLAETHKLNVIRRIGQARPELWWALSSDGLWSYERQEEPGTPWLVTFLPTGQVQVFGNLRSARLWTATDAALILLATLAAENRTEATANDRTHAAAQYATMTAVFDGALIVGVEPTSGCRCGGLLAQAGNGPWVHVNACGACWSVQDGLTQPCPEIESHRHCADAEPTQCAHCYRPSSVEYGTCQYDRDDCCGCCDR